MRSKDNVPFSGLCPLMANFSNSGLYPGILGTDQEISHNDEIFLDKERAFNSENSELFFFVD